MPVVPTALGFDPRLQLLHEDDAVEVLRLATRVATARASSTSPATASCRCRRSSAGPAGSGSRSRRRRSAWSARLVRNSGAVDFTAEDASFLNFGRVVDTTRLRDRVRLHARATRRPRRVESFLRRSRPAPPGAWPASA